MIASQSGAQEFGLQATHLRAKIQQDLAANRQNHHALVWVRDRHTAIARCAVMSGPDRLWNHAWTGAPQATIALDAPCHVWGAQLLNPPSRARREMRDRFQVEESHTGLGQEGELRAAEGTAGGS
jgi:hypothetical protein